MTGNNYNNQRGQVLLITIMLLAVLLTVVLSLSFTSRTETQLTKLEEESQKALAAAEAGIEAAIKQNVGTSVAIGSLEGLSNFTGQASVAQTTGSEFASPLVQKDQQYTFYLSDYNKETRSFSNPYNGTITLFYGSKKDEHCENSSSAIALEVTVVSGNSAPYTITREISDGGRRLGNGQGKYKTSRENTIAGVSFACETDAINIRPPIVNPKLMFVRPLFISAGARIGFRGDVDLKPQGSIITSEAKSSTGVTKKVQLFQSYPQIPADFFVTSF